VYTRRWLEEMAAASLAYDDNDDMSRREGEGGWENAAGRGMEVAAVLRSLTECMGSRRACLDEVAGLQCNAWGRVQAAAMAPSLLGSSGDLGVPWTCRLAQADLSESDVVGIALQCSRAILRTVELDPSWSLDDGRVLRQAVMELEREWRMARRRVMLDCRRAHEAHRDARLVFRAAAEGRPLELQKRLVLGKLAGGVTAGVLSASREAGHAEC